MSKKHSIVFCQIADGCAVEQNRIEKHCACFHSAFLISSIMLYFSVVR